MQIQPIPTLTLTVHPLVEWLPALSQERPEFHALRDSIAEHGITTPLHVCKGRVVDGRDRLRAAASLGLDTVPCIEVTEEDVSAITLVNLCQRKHYSKGALAYLMYPLLVPELEAARKRRLQMLTSGGKEHSSPNALCSELGVPKTVEDIAKFHGFSRKTIFEAQGVHRRFQERPELREKYEPRLIAGELSLGEVIQGTNGDIAAADGKTVPFRNPADLFSGAWEVVGKRLDYWGKLDEPARRRALEQIGETFAAMPPDLRDAIAAALKKAATAAPLEVVR